MTDGLTRSDPARRGPTRDGPRPETRGHGRSNPVYTVYNIEGGAETVRSANTMEDDAPGSLPETTRYELLSHQRRRILLRTLRDGDAPIAVTELAALVGEREFVDPSDEDRRAVHLSLHHWHLPKLEDAAVLTYDWDDGTVRLGPNFGGLVVLLEAADEIFVG